MRAPLSLSAALTAAFAALAAAATTLAPAPAAAQPGGRVVGTVKVTEPDGKPVSGTDVIVYMLGFNEPPTDQVATIAQKGRKFVPDLVAITANERVSFPNNDPFLHNVFSQSADRQFDLGSYKRGESKDKQFSKPGVIDVYCNIHPEMAATIIVVPNRRHTRVDPAGHFTLDGVPPGEWTVFAYARRSKAVERQGQHQAGRRDHRRAHDRPRRRAGSPQQVRREVQRRRPGLQGPLISLRPDLDSVDRMRSGAAASCGVQVAQSSKTSASVAAESTRSAHVSICSLEAASMRRSDASSSWSPKRRRSSRRSTWRAPSCMALLRQIS